jgi:hypothetical protein
MSGDELRVEQSEAAIFQPGDQVDEGDLARVAGSREHALAEERAAEMHAVKPSHKLSVLPDLHGVAMAQRKQFAIKAPDAPIDPGRPPA